MEEKIIEVQFQKPILLKERVSPTITLFNPINMKKYTILGILFLLGAGLLYYVISSIDLAAVWNTLSQISLANYLIYLALGFGVFTLYTLRWKLILNCHGHSLSFIKMYWYRLSAYGISYLTPSQLGGEPVRIYLAAESDNVRLRDVVSSVLTDKLFEVSALLTFIAAGVIYLAFTNLVANGAQSVLFAIVIFLIALLVYTYHRLVSGKGVLAPLFRTVRLHKIKSISKFESKLIRTENRVAHFLSKEEHQRLAIPLAGLISIGIVAFIIFEHWLLAYFLGVNLTVTQAFIVSTIPLIAYMIPIPLGVGIYEGAHITLFSLLGYEPSFALSIVLAIRTKDIIISIFSLIYASTHGVHLIGRRRNIPTKKEIKEIQKEQLSPRQLSQFQPPQHHDHQKPHHHPKLTETSK
jgi:glycosyltransferase 2 family protein